MKHRIMLATTALLAACGEAPAPTQPNGVALAGGFSTSANAVGPAAVPYTTVGASTFTVPAGVTSLHLNYVRPWMHSASLIENCILNTGYFSYEYS